MATASLYLASSRPDHARATTLRGACTAAEGLDAETFRGFPLAGDLFLLTSFFIERISVDVLHVRSELGEQNSAPLREEDFAIGMPEELVRCLGHFPSGGPFGSSQSGGGSCSAKSHLSERQRRSVRLPNSPW